MWCPMHSCMHSHMLTCSAQRPWFRPLMPHSAACAAPHGVSAMRPACMPRSHIVARGSNMGPGPTQPDGDAQRSVRGSNTVRRNKQGTSGKQGPTDTEQPAEKRAGRAGTSHDGKGTRTHSQDRTKSRMRSGRTPDDSTHGTYSENAEHSRGSSSGGSANGDWGWGWSSELPSASRTQHQATQHTERGSHPATTRVQQQQQQQQPRGPKQQEHKQGKQGQKKQLEPGLQQQQQQRRRQTTSTPTARVSSGSTGLKPSNPALPAPHRPPPPAAPATAHHPSSSSLQQTVPAGALDYCVHYGRCSGCSLWEDLGAGPPQYTTARNYFASLGLRTFPLLAGPHAGWRCRAKLAVRGAAGAPEIGLFARGSHEVVPIPSCTAHHPRINEAVQLIQQLVASQHIEPFDEGRGSGRLRYLQLTVVSPGGEAPPPDAPPAQDNPHAQVQVVLVWRAQGPDCPSYSQAHALGERLWALGGGKLIHSVWVNFHPTVTASSKQSSSGSSSGGFPSPWGPPPGSSNGSSNINDTSTSTCVSSATGGTSSDSKSSTAGTAGSTPAGGGSTGDSANAVLGRGGWAHVAGPANAWQAWVPGGAVCLSAGSFVQANYGAFSCVLHAMAAALPPGAATVTELHAGVGAIGLSLLALAPGLRRLRCVEVNGSGASPFASSAAHLARTRPSSLQHSASGSPHTPAAAPELCYEVGAAGSRTAEFLSCADVVVVDPPRKGLEPELLSELSRCDWPRRARVSGDPAVLPPRRLLYLSCGFPALVRDAAVLLGRTAPSSSTTPAPVPAGTVAGSSRAGASATNDSVNVARGGSSGSVRSSTSNDMTASSTRVSSAMGGTPRWRLVCASAHLFFPGTDAIETLAVFEEICA